MDLLLKDIAVLNRQRKEMGNLLELAASIQRNGLIHSITVRPTSDAEREGGVKEPWVLVTGGRRYAAHVILKRETIRAEDLSAMGEYKRAAIELEENLVRQDMTWDEIVRSKAEIHRLYLIENPNQTMSETADILGEHKSTFTRDLELARQVAANPELRKASSKKSAQRKVRLDETVRQRIASIKATDIHELRSKLVVADARNYVRTLSDRSVDLHFADFPFGIDYWQGRSELSDGYYEDSPERLKDFMTDVVPHMLRSLKPTGWLAIMMAEGNSQFLKDLIDDACITHCEYRDRAHHHGVYCTAKTLRKEGGECKFLQSEKPSWVWFRPNSRQPSKHPHLHARNQYEMIVLANGGEAHLVKQDVGNVLMFNAVYTDRLHEMQRPMELCVEVIERLTHVGEKVVDITFGSGQHLAAAALLKRDFAGCDIDPESVARAIANVSQHYTPRGAFDTVGA